MANYRKSFNFRYGVQVDEDNFIVNPVGLVGIGTTVPTELLDVLGNANISGILSVGQIYVDNIVNTEASEFTKITVGVTSITSGIITGASGVVTYFGDGSKLLNLPTSQWLDVDVGLGFTSIYAQGFVGVGTVDPRFLFQIGGNNNILAFSEGVGIDPKGNILATGIVTATTFVGIGSNLTLLDASSISSGTLNNLRLPSDIDVSGIITAGNYFKGTFVGVADTANSITPTANITVNSITHQFSQSSISTVTNTLNVNDLLFVSQRTGIGTTNPIADLHIRKNGVSDIQITSDGDNEARLTLGRNVSRLSNNAELRFGNTNTGFPDSTDKSFDILNYDTGNINLYLNAGVAGINTGNFNWINGQSLEKIMVLTYDGRLGLGTDDPVGDFQVVGTSTVTGNSFVSGNLSVGGSFSPSTIRVVNEAFFGGNIGILTSNPLYPVQIGREPFRADGGLALFRNGDVWTAGVVTATRFSGDGSTLTNLNAASLSGTLNQNVTVSVVGVVTASRFSGDGSTLTNLEPENISSGSLTGNININTTGIISATSFVGLGSDITNIRPENIVDGSIDGDYDITTTGIVTAASFVGDGSAITNLTPENINDGNITIVGDVTSSRFFGNGFNLTDLNPLEISDGLIEGIVDVNTTGFVTAFGFEGDGSLITNIDPVNIQDGTINGSINIITDGSITASELSGDGSGLTALTPENIVDGSIDSQINISNCGIITAFDGFLSSGQYPIQIAVVSTDTGNKLRFTIPGLSETVTLSFDP